MMPVIVPRTPLTPASLPIPKASTAAPRPIQTQDGIVIFPRRAAVGIITTTNKQASNKGITIPSLAAKRSSPKEVARVGEIILVLSPGVGAMASKFLCRLAARPHPLNAAGQSITLQQDLSRPLPVLDLSAAPNRQKAQPAEFKLYNFTEFM